MNVLALVDLRNFPTAVANISTFDTRSRVFVESRSTRGVAVKVARSFTRKGFGLLRP